MSFRNHILVSLLSTALLTILFSVGMSYKTVQNRLDLLVNDLSYKEAAEIALRLGNLYNRDNNWDDLELVISDYPGTGNTYRFKGESSDESENRRSFFNFFSEEEHSEKKEGEIEHPNRIVITNQVNRTIYDNYRILPLNSYVPELEGQHALILNPGNTKTLGNVYINMNQEFLAPESNGFLNSILLITSIGGVFIAFLTLLLSSWLSKRITKPVTNLTIATRSIIDGREYKALAITSKDELGEMSMVFNKMTASLKSQKELRKRLIDDLTHELNTPLSIINLEAKGMSDGFQSPEDASHNIIEEIKKLKDLVQDLNWLAESDSGELQYSFTPQSLDALITEEIERWQQKAHQERIVLSYNSSDQDLIIKMDRMRFSQALGNIIRNAIQHTPIDGLVSVDIQEYDKTLDIIVTDTGSGINAKDLSSLFDRFYRSVVDKSENPSGKGLGLTISREIIEAHNGKIQIQSMGADKGTTVIISMKKNT